MTTTQNDVQLVLDSVSELLGDQVAWIEPTGYPESLAHCIIDSVFSLRAHYSAVINVHSRYDEARRKAGEDPSTDGVPELLRAIEDVGGAEEAATKLFGNRGKAPGTKTLKSAAVWAGAEALKSAGVLTAEDLRATAGDDARQDEVRRAWFSVSGLGVASWRYVLMLAGVDGTKPDRMIRRFVTNAVGADSLVGVDRARVAIERAAASLTDVSVFKLDHAVWRYQSGRTAGPEEVFVG